VVNESRSEPVQWAMSRYVPRPPWSSSNESTSEPSAPRPPARRVFVHRRGTKVASSGVSGVRPSKSTPFLATLTTASS